VETTVHSEYEQARHVLRSLMGPAEASAHWQGGNAEEGMAGVFARVIDDLYRDRTCLLDLLRRRDAYRSLQLSREGEWAELEEIE